MDEIHPFSDTVSVDVVLRDSERMLLPEMDAVGPKNASRIWGFMSKFVMLDRFLKTLGLAQMYVGHPVPRKIFSRDYLGTASKVSFTTNFSFFYQMHYRY